MKFYEIKYHDYTIVIHKEEDGYKLIFQDMDVCCDTFEQVLESGYTLVLVALKEADFQKAHKRKMNEPTRLASQQIHRLD